MSSLLNEQWRRNLLGEQYLDEAKVLDITRVGDFLKNAEAAWESLVRSYRDDTMDFVTLCVRRMREQDRYKSLFSRMTDYKTKIGGRYGFGVIFTFPKNKTYTLTFEVDKATGRPTSCVFLEGQKVVKEFKSNMTPFDIGDWVENYLRTNQ